LEAKVEEEAAERRRLAEQVGALATQLAALGGRADETAITRVTSGAASPAAATPASDATNANVVGDSTSAMERALVAAGLDPASAANIKRRGDALDLTEMNLRDQATREQWLDSPRFAEEMAALEAQRTSVRDEIGDDAYDRYLLAVGQANRVQIHDVMSQSPAEQAGLQAGDLIMRYGDTRIFALDELVGQTRGGTLGETVPLQIIRNGKSLEVDVPRGPLGLRIEATQDQPPAR
jgi:C-terminal processing protease CtpA/Prc